MDNIMKILAVAVTSKDGEFEDSVKVFVGPDASEQAGSWFREGIAQAIRLNWMTIHHQALNKVADRIEQASTIEDVRTLASEALDLVQGDDEAEAWEIQILVDEAEQ